MEQICGCRCCYPASLAHRDRISINGPEVGQELSREPSEVKPGEK